MAYRLFAIGFRHVVKCKRHTVTHSAASFFK